MDLKVIREIKTDQSTIGRFFVNGFFEAYCLEPVDRGLTSNMTLAQIAAIKVPGKTALPIGKYVMDWYKSPIHGIWLPRILNVPGFDDDEIHIGNVAKDTKGCLLLGTEKGDNIVLHSKVAIDAFYPKFLKAFKKPEPVYITYE